MPSYIGLGLKIVSRLCLNKKALPSMKTFFYICEYLEITPKDFFHFSQRYPETLVPLIADLEALDGEQLEHIAAIVKSMKK